MQILVLKLFFFLTKSIDETTAEAGKCKRLRIDLVLLEIPHCSIKNRYKETIKIYQISLNVKDLIYFLPSGNLVGKQGLHAT